MDPRVVLDGLVFPEGPLARRAVWFSGMQLWLSDPVPAESRLQARLKDREREVTGRIQQMHKDLTQAEVLREELRRDIALCERHSTQLGDQTLRKERGI